MSMSSIFLHDSEKYLVNNDVLMVYDMMLYLSLSVFGSQISFFDQLKTIGSWQKEISAVQKGAD